jgi:hypothetical protein
MFHRRIATLANNIGGPELLAQRDAVGMAPEKNDPFGAAASGGNHTAQANGAIANHGRRLAWSDSGRNGGVMPGRHHVRQSEQ